VDDHSSDDGEQTPKNPDPQNVGEKTVPVLTEAVAESGLNVSVDNDILQADQNGKDDSVESKNSGDGSGRDDSLEPGKSGGEGGQTPNPAVHRDRNREKVASVSAVVEVNDDGPSSARQPQMDPSDPRVDDLAGLEEVDTLTSSRFGETKLLRRKRPTGEWETIVGKFYNTGEVRDSPAVFQEQVDRFLSLSHRHVLRIVGLIAPTASAGPIVLMEYRENGSLLDVLTRVERNDPPAFWNDAGKLRMILSIVSGLQYLHSQGVVHRELKPSDLIVSDDGSIEISDYLTSFFEDKKYTRTSKVNTPLYMAPETYEDKSQMNKNRDPATDVFLFALILFEIVFEEKVFPAILSAAVIMQKAKGSPRGQLKVGDRPLIKPTLHQILREMISRGWSPQLEKRPTFEEMWKKLQGVKFRVFPNVDVLISERKSNYPTI
jgi:serine/threonine protein kinase